MLFKSQKTNGFNLEKTKTRNLHAYENLLGHIKTSSVSHLMTFFTSVFNMYQINHLPFNSSKTSNSFSLPNISKKNLAL